MSLHVFLRHTTEGGSLYLPPSVMPSALPRPLTGVPLLHCGHGHVQRYPACGLAIFDLPPNKHDIADESAWPHQRYQ